MHSQQTQNAKRVQQSRNSNFSFSQSSRPAPFANTTSAGQAFTPGKLKLKELANVGDARSMRVANFKMGFEQVTDYGTTTDANNKFFNEAKNRDSLTEQRSKQLLAQRDRVIKNRQPHYDFGRAQLDYQTIAARQFQQHDLSQVKQSKIERINNGKDVRKCHFVFGTDANPHVPQTTTATTTAAQTKQI